MADFFAYYTFMTARIIAKKTWGWDIAADIDGLRDWLTLMSERPMIAQMNKEHRAAIEKMQLG
jgi:glutathione S-transferase